METYQEQKQREHREKHPQQIGFENNTLIWWILGILAVGIFVYMLTHTGGGEPSDYGFILLVK